MKYSTRPIDRDFQRPTPQSEWTQTFMDLVGGVGLMFLVFLIVFLLLGA